MSPLESHMNRFSDLTPSARYSFAQEIAEAPAPLKTTLTSSIFFSDISKAFSKAAAVIMAVPC